MVKLLFQRLMNRGYEDKIITPIFNEAALKIETKITSNYKKTEKPLQSGNRIFFHLEYHKRDVSRQFVRDAYETTCDTLDTKGRSFKCYPTPDDTNMMIKQATIAYEGVRCVCGAPPRHWCAHRPPDASGFRDPEGAPLSQFPPL